jgi:hypothetical protein
MTYSHHYRGKSVTQLDEKEGITFADIDISLIDKARAGIPVTVQRRFDVCASFRLILSVISADSSLSTDPDVAKE